MAVQSLWVKCDWCEDERTFRGEDPERDWRESGWLIYLNDDGEQNFCSIECAIAAL